MPLSGSDSPCHRQLLPVALGARDSQRHRQLLLVALAASYSWMCHCNSAHTLPICRYSPNLSRRCTHLAVYGQQGSARAAKPQQSRSGHCSEKLCTAVRNRAKWGLCIVDIDWLVQSARAGKRLDEAAFPATLPPLPLPLSGAKEQAAAQAVGNGPAGSSSVASSWGSLQAADTHACHSGRQHGPFVATTAGSAGKQAQRAAAQPLQQSVNSRPLTSFGQLSRSLHTQLPSVDRSMCAQGPAATEQTAGRTDSVARVGAPWGVQSAAVAGGPPELQTRFGHDDSESGELMPLRCTSSLLLSQVYPSAGQLQQATHKQHNRQSFSSSTVCWCCLPHCASIQRLTTQTTSAPCCRRRHRLRSPSHDTSRLHTR